MSTTRVEIANYGAIVRLSEEIKILLYVYIHRYIYEIRERMRNANGPEK